METDIQHNKEKKQSAWQQHNVEHFQSFRSLDLYTKISAIEGMADTLRHFEELKKSKN